MKTFDYILEIDREAYASVQSYSKAYGTSIHMIAKTGRTRLVLDTLVVGPLTDDEYQRLKKFSSGVMSFDEQFADLIPAPAGTQVIPVRGAKTVEWNGYTLVRLADIVLANKYRIKEFMPTVRVFSQLQYVVLGMVREGAGRKVAVVLED